MQAAAAWSRRHVRALVVTGVALLVAIGLAAAAGWHFSSVALVPDHSEWPLETRVEAVEPGRIVLSRDDHSSQPGVYGLDWPFRLTAGWVYELPFGSDKPFFSNGGIAAKILGGWQTSGTYEYQPGALLDWGNLFFNGNYSDIRIAHPQIALQPDGTVDATKKWFNTDAGFEKDPAKQPALFQKRVFPFRIDGVRGFNFTQLNLNVGRRFELGGRRTMQFRMDLQNALNRQQWGNPNLDPTSTNFGLVTSINATVMRFVTFVTKVSF